MTEKQYSIELLERLRAIAPHVNRLTLDGMAASGYEVLAGAIVWEDEIPPPGTVSPDLIEALKAVLRYRTTLILGLPDAKYEGAWRDAQELFPQWPGFCPSRAG